MSVKAKQIVSKNIKIYRLQQGFTQQELAKKTGYKVQYISRIESKPQNLTLDVIENLAEGLNVKVVDLVSEIKFKANSKINKKQIDSAIHILEVFKEVI